MLKLWQMQLTTACERSVSWAEYGAERGRKVGLAEQYSELRKSGKKSGVERGVAERERNGERAMSQCLPLMVTDACCLLF